MRRNQTYIKREDGTMSLLIDTIVPDIFEPITRELLSETLDNVNISSMSLTDIITTYPITTPNTATDINVITSYRTQRLLSLSTDSNEERVNKTIKQLILLGFAHEVRIRVLEGKVTTAPDRAVADSVTIDFIAFVTSFRTIRQEGENYKIAQGF